MTQPPYEVRCPRCGKLLLTLQVVAITEIRCYHGCKVLVRWPILLAEVVPQAETMRQERRFNPT